jgi:hypothetical protein
MEREFDLAMNQIDSLQETGRTFFKLARELNKKETGVKNERKKSSRLRRG